MGDYLLTKPRQNLSKYVSTDVQKKFYQGYILPLIHYGSVVWETTSSPNLDIKTCSTNNTTCRYSVSGNIQRIKLATNSFSKTSQRERERERGERERERECVFFQYFYKPLYDNLCAKLKIQIYVNLCIQVFVVRSK